MFDDLIGCNCFNQRIFERVAIMLAGFSILVWLLCARVYTNSSRLETNSGRTFTIPKYTKFTLAVLCVYKIWAQYQNVRNLSNFIFFSCCVTKKTQHRRY